MRRKIIQFPIYPAWLKNMPKWILPDAPQVTAWKTIDDDPADHRPKVSVMIGDNIDSGCGTAILDYLETSCLENYRVKTFFSHKADEILAVADSIDIDLFIIFLGNVHYSYLGEDPDEWPMQFCKLIKSKFNAPIIGLSSWEDPLRIERVKKIVDFYFGLPPYLGSVAAAFERCLQREPPPPMKCSGWRYTCNKFSIDNGYDDFERRNNLTFVPALSRWVCRVCLRKYREEVES